MNKKEFKKHCNTVVIDTGLIPKQTPYCYSIDVTRLKGKNLLSEDGSLPINLCPYYVRGKGGFTGCLYTKDYIADIVFADQVKICDK